MVAKNLSVNVIGCPIHRESNNLAMSSRNERLVQKKEQAALIYKTLAEVKKNLQPTVLLHEWVQKRFKTILILL
jgi:pantoate--beta-alanine ligase